MPRADFSLDQLRIESPCHADLDRMPGDNRRRFCTECNLHVTNVSAMNRADAEAFLANRGERTCVQIDRTADGKIIAADDPWKTRVKAKWSRRFARAAAVAGLGTLLLNFLGGCMAGKTAGDFETLAQRDARQAEEKARCVTVAGMVSVPGPPATQPVSPTDKPGS